MAILAVHHVLQWTSGMTNLVFSKICGMNYTYTRWCPGSIAKLVNITPITMVFVGDISIVNVIINQLITGGHHLVGLPQSSERTQEDIIWRFPEIGLSLIFRGFSTHVGKTMPFAHTIPQSPCFSVVSTYHSQKVMGSL